MKKHLPAVRVLLRVFVVVLVGVYPPVRIFALTPGPNFIASDVHFVATGSDKLHITATVRSNNHTAAPLCYIGALTKNLGQVDMEDYVAGPSLKVGQSWQLTDDLVVLNEDAVKVDHAKVDCLDIL